MADHDDRYNSSGCKDMTAYYAIKSVQEQERRELIEELKAVANEHGYEIVNAIRLKEIDD